MFTIVFFLSIVSPIDLGFDIKAKNKFPAVNDGAKPRAMKPVFSSIILLGCLVFGAHGGLRNSFSVVALPFRYYGIAPDLVEVAPTEMCQVSVGDEAEHCSCGFY